MNAMDKLEARMRLAERLMLFYDAERQGLARAKYTAEPVAFSPDPEIQARFDLGQREGREILTVHGAVGHAV